MKRSKLGKLVGNTIAGLHVAMCVTKAIKARPIYLLVVERVLSHIALEELEKLEKNLDKIAKKRDDIVSQLYRTMFFLASLLILIFLIEINLIAIPSTVWGVRITVDKSSSLAQSEDVVNNQDILIFGLLLIGNIVALLFSSAMVKGFMLEYIIKTYYSLTADVPDRFIAGATYRFYVFVFGLIAEQKQLGMPKVIRQIAEGIHWTTVVVLPLTFICLYCFVLGRALTLFWNKSPGGIDLLGINIEMWYFWVLVFFNAVTLSFYAFAFFPYPIPVISYERFQELVKQRANDLWEQAGRPSHKQQEIELLAERQVRLGFSVREVGREIDVSKILSARVGFRDADSDDT